MANILIADDEYTIRYGLRRFLEQKGHTVFEACDGEDALSIMASQPVDAAVVDIIMPNKEGVETIIEVRRQYPNVKIIAMSGGGRNRDVDFLKIAKQCGAQDILRKPFTNEELLKILAF